MSDVFSTEEEAAKQYERLRRDTGASADLLGDPDAELYFVESQESYPFDTAKMIAHTRVLVLQGFLANSALLGKYAQNQSQEDLTKVYDNLKDLLTYWSDKVDVVVDIIDPTTLQPFFFGLASGNRGY
jgi:hypothetical protein